MPMNTDLHRYDHVIIHCSATRPDQNIGSVEIDQWHRDRGWRGCGYHVVIRRDTVVETADDGYPTRPWDQPGAHVGDCGPGWNSRSLGVCLVGGIDEDGRPDANFHGAQLISLRNFLSGIRWFLNNYDPPRPMLRVMGHRDLIRQTGATPKACPCFDVDVWWYKNTTDLTTDDQREDALSPSRSLLVSGWWEVREGDTLWRIASRTGVPISRIREMNPRLGSSDVIRPGDKIVLR